MKKWWNKFLIFIGWKFEEKPIVTKQSFNYNYTLSELYNKFPKTSKKFEEWMYNKAIDGDNTRTPSSEDLFIIYKQLPDRLVYGCLLLYCDSEQMYILSGTKIGEREITIKYEIWKMFENMENKINAFSGYGANCTTIHPIVKIKL